MGIFSLMMVLILGFYVYSIRISDHRNASSDRYRRLVSVFDRIQVTLEAAWVLGVADEGTTLYYCPQEELAILRGRVVYPNQCQVLRVQEQSVVREIGEKSEQLLKLKPQERLSFKAGTRDRNHRLQYLDVEFFVPRDGEGEVPEAMVRRILLEER